MTPLGVLLCPVRHHSPRSSEVTRALLDRESPEVVLIEGPSDTMSLVDVILDAETRPPIAILGYRTDGTVGSCLWPFASYSPELVALRWAREHGARARFIDVPVGVALAAQSLEDEEADKTKADGKKGEAGDPGHPHASHGSPGPQGSQGSQGSRGADAPASIEHESEGISPGDSEEDEPSRTPHGELGFRSFEEFWEARIEAPGYDPADFRDAILGYAGLVRERHSRPYDLARDAVMYRAVQDEIARGVDPSRIAVVVGAAHASAMLTGEIDPASEQTLPAAVSSAFTVIPFSFPRLSEMSGYGAGNRAPRFYQRAFDAGCDFERAALDMILEICASMREQGFTASLADAVEAYRLARSLAGLRDKHGPGLDELREAVVATIGRGDGIAVDRALAASTIGSQIGHVASRIGQNSLQREFWSEVDRHGLPRQDRPSQVLLHLSREDESAAAQFLQRLRVSKIPFASFVGLMRSVPVPHEKRPAPGGIEALRRASEAWEVQWTPATDVALVERIVLGDTLEQVTTRTLARRLDEAKTTRAGAEILLDAVLASCSLAIHRALDVCESMARDDEDVPSLAGACAALSALISFGAHRAVSTSVSQALEPLCRNTFRRAALRMRAACEGDAEAVKPVRVAMRALHEVALAQPIVDPDLWWDTARQIADDQGVHPSASGFAAGLLHIAERIEDGELGMLVELRLSDAHDPSRSASFLEGFLEVSAASIVRSRPVVNALDGFMARLSPDQFRDLLPPLRRALGPLTLTSKRYLLETVASVRGLGQKIAPAQALSAVQKEQLEAVHEDLSKVMDDLDDLL